MPIYRLSKELAFPPAHLATEEGLLAVGGDLSPDRLLLAYKMGIFPWFSRGDPILWWSPDPRLVLYPQELKISRSLKKTMRKDHYKITMDQAFKRVITICAKIREDAGKGTWITSQMITAYCRLHRMGYAHSVETWCRGMLVGGLYGVSLGRSFFGESMFSTMSDASKVALVHLCRFLLAHDFNFIDCQLPNDHLARLGARQISRRDFLAQLKPSVQYPSLAGYWRE